MPEHVGYVTVPLYKTGARELAGLRQQMLEAGPHAVSSGAGLGSDGVWLEIGRANEDHHDYYYVHGRDLLAATLSHLDLPDSTRVPTTEGYKK